MSKLRALNTLIYSEQAGLFWSFSDLRPNWYLKFGNRTYAVSTSGGISAINDNQLTSDSLLQLIINKDIQFTKTFDNIEFVGEFGHDKTFESVDFKTATIEGKQLTSSIDKREDTYKAVIPRDKTSDKFGSRLRGKYMISEYKYKSDGYSKMNLPYIKTKYRNSLI